MKKNDYSLNKYKGPSVAKDLHQTNSVSALKISISDSSLNHSSIGEYNSNNRPKSGGHGQDAIDYMDEHGIPYEINIEYENGVRVGNMPTSIEKMKRSGNLQTWFPKSWTAEYIKNSGLEVAKTFKGAPKRGDHHTGLINGVSVTVIFGDNGIINTIYPSSEQPGGSKNDK